MAGRNGGGMVAGCGQGSSDPQPHRHPNPDFRLILSLPFATHQQWGSKNCPPPCRLHPRQPFTDGRGGRATGRHCRHETRGKKSNYTCADVRGFNFHFKKLYSSSNASFCFCDCLLSFLFVLYIPFCVYNLICDTGCHF